MSLNPSGMGSGTSWNMSRPNDEGYSLELWGTVVSLQEVQARMFNPNSKQPGPPRFWNDGNPVMNIRMGLAQPDGSLKSVTFNKAGKKQVSGEKPSLHMQLFHLTNNNMSELIGKTIHLWTWPANPQTGQTWGQGNPRLFGVEEVKDTKYELSSPLPPEFTVPELLANDGAQGGQPMPPSPQQMMSAGVMPMQGGYFAAPQPMQPMPQQMPPMQQAPAPQPMAPQPAPQPMAPQMQTPPQPVSASMPQGAGAMPPVPTVQQMPPQPAGAPMPQGMDPAVAQAMQAIGATNVQPMDTSVYDDDIPFNQA